MKRIVLILISVFLIIISFALAPYQKSMALPVPGKAEFSYQLYYYWDLRDRDSFIQVTNNGTSTLNLHIQVFDTVNSCNENDFFDEYTPDDTHIYNLRNIQSNDGNPTGIAGFPDNSYGFVVVTVVDGSGVADDSEPVLSGNLRIVSEDGYEYRSVAASYPVIDTISSTDNFSFNFSAIDTNTFADVVGIAVNNSGAGFEFVEAGASAVTEFSLIMFDNIENAQSCPVESFSCAANVGINETIPNSKGVAANLCPFVPIAEGFARMTLLTSSSTADFFVGFVGINNGNNRGGMEIVTALP